MSYSTTSNTTRAFCAEKYFSFAARFVETMERNGKIYVRYTLAKPHEIAALKAACDGDKYIYKGR